MSSPRLALGSLAWSFALLAGTPASAQTCPIPLGTFGPMAADFRTSQTVAYDQVWSMAARGSNGWTFAWSASQDVWARRFNLSLSPIGNAFHVNTQFFVGIQDEPAISFGIRPTTI